MKIFILFAVLLCGLTSAVGCQTTLRTEPPVYTAVRMNFSGHQNEVDYSTNEIKKPKGIVTLDEALFATLGRHPGLSAASYNVRAFDGTIQQAGALPNPSLTGELEDFGGSGEFTGTDVMASKIGISQQIPVTGKITRRVDVAKAMKSIAEMEYAARSLALKTEVKKRFLEVYTLQEQLSLEEENVAVLKSLKDVVNKRITAGEASPLEGMKVTVQLESADIALERVKSEFESSKYALASSWGGEATDFTQVKSAYSPDIRIPDETALPEILESNPSYHILEEKVSLSLAALYLARSEKWMDLEVGGGIQRFNETGDHAFFMEVSIPIPILNRNGGNIEEAVQRHNQSKKELEAGVIELKVGLHQVIKKLVPTQKAYIGTRDSVLPAAKEAFDSVKKAYLIGEQSYIELLEAQRAYLTARQEHLALFNELQTLIIEMEKFADRSIGNQD